MKGIKRYIRKYGKHFTVELAYHLAGRRWSSHEVMRSAQREVYYNVTGSTVGDMTFMANIFWYQDGYRKKECIKMMLDIVGDFSYYGGVLFDEWCESVEMRDFDFTPYI